MVSIDFLLDYLGVDEDSKEIVETLAKTAVADLGENADAIAAENPDLINEYIMSAVYLSFYALRGEEKNTQYIEQRKNSLAVKLGLRVDDGI